MNVDNGNRDISSSSSIKDQSREGREESLSLSPLSGDDIGNGSDSDASSTAAKTEAHLLAFMNSRRVHMEKEADERALRTHQDRLRRKRSLQQTIDDSLGQDSHMHEVATGLRLAFEHESEMMNQKATQVARDAARLVTLKNQQQKHYQALGVNGVESVNDVASMDIDSGQQQLQQQQQQVEWIYSLDYLQEDGGVTDTPVPTVTPAISPQSTTAKAAATAAVAVAATAAAATATAEESALKKSKLLPFRSPARD